MVNSHSLPYSVPKKVYAIGAEQTPAQYSSVMLSLAAKPGVRARVPLASLWQPR